MIDPAPTPAMDTPIPDLPAMLESLPDAYLIVLANDPVFTVIAVNAAFEKIAKTGKERMLGRGFFEVFPQGPNNILAALQRVIEHPEPQSPPAINFGLPASEAGAEEQSWRRVHTPILSSSGEVTHIAVRAFPLDLNPRERADAESRKVSEAIQQHWRLFDTALDSTPDFTYIFDLEGRFTYVNRPLLALWGKSLEEALGKNFFELNYPLELAARLQRQIQQVITTGARLSDETAYTGVDGSEGYYEYIFVPVLAGDGTVEAVAGSTRDITRRNAAEAERERLMAKLAENNRDLVRANEALIRANRELEEFAYVSSHDLQEPLRTINIYTQLLLKKHVSAGQPEARQYAEFVNNGVHRMEALIHDVLSYSQAIHSQSSPGETVNLAAALCQALSALQPLIADSHANITAGDLPVVAGDEEQLAKVFENLISNALKYRNATEAPVIRIAATHAGNEWVIEVNDNGIGFEPQYARDIFGLFKRLHRGAYPGTGLGLAICRRIVERYGGRIWAQSELGRGATFYFALPEVAASTSLGPPQ